MNAMNTMNTPNIQIINRYNPDPSAMRRACEIMLSLPVPVVPAPPVPAPSLAEDPEDIEGDTFARAEFAEQMEAEASGRERWEVETEEARLLDGTRLGGGIYEGREDKPACAAV